MPSEEAKTSPVQLQGEAILQIQRAANPGRPIVYANNCLIIGTQFDVQLYFSLVHEVEPAKFMAVDGACIIMAPEQALLLVKALQSNLERYQETQGKIREIKPVEPPSAAIAPGKNSLPK